MRATPETKGVIESGFKRVDDGWHVFKFLEGIDYLKKKTEGGGEEIAVNKQGDKLWKIPMVVDDEEDDSHEVQHDLILAENKKGEQALTNYLGAVGLAAKFEKAFPGDTSVFEDKVMAKVKSNLPGQFMRFKTKQNEYKAKDGSQQIAVNLAGFGAMSDSVDALEAELFPAKEAKSSGGAKGGKKPAGAEKPPVVDEDF